MLNCRRKNNRSNRSFQFDALERRSHFSSTPAPSSLVGTVAASNAISLSWQDNSSTETGFGVERSLDGVYYSQVAATGANVTSFQDSGLTPGYPYTYHVRALDAAGGSAYSNSASVLLPAPTLPNAPSNLTTKMTVGKRKQVSTTLTWQDNSSNEERFYVDISTDGVHWTTLTDVAANGTSLTLSGLQHGTTYYFKVAASNSSGLSAWSNVASVVA